MNEKLTPLGGDIKIYSNDDYRYGTDAILLANFAAPKKNDLAIDLGAGGGIIPMLWCKKDMKNAVFALEIQQKACELLKKSAEVSGVTERIKILGMDMKNVRELELCGRFDLVSSNPPYGNGSSLLNESDARSMARHEIACDINDVCEAAARLLKTGGRACLCSRPERLADVICVMRSAGIEAKKLRFVCARRGTEPWLFLVEGKKGAAAGLRVSPTLYMEEKGEISEEAKEIYQLTVNN